MSAYFYIARMKLLVFLTYRFEVLTTLGTNLIILMANIFLWKTAYRGTNAIFGVTETQMLTYTVVSVLLSSFYSFNIENTLQERIAQGNIALDFLKPINLIIGYFFGFILRPYYSLMSLLSDWMSKLNIP
jgi:ABC-2 type transport system permease protein